MAVIEDSGELAPSEVERTALKEGIERLCREYQDMVVVSFPCNEKVLADALL